jgi:predicted Zn-dependent protease
MTPSGAELFWANPNVPVKISTNTTDLSAVQTVNIISDSMNQWNQNSPAQILNSSSSTNKIEFVSDFPYGSAVLGLTELSYNSNGAIQKASILLNDDYTFKANPGLYGAGEVYLGDVVTHEIGHLFGLSHSEVLNSSMFYSSYSGQSSLSSDDKSGIRAKYGQNYGTITGFVKGGSSIGVLGVHVQAISRKTGESIGAISDETGSFVVSGLDLNDTYYIYTSPIKNPNSLPGYFANVQNEF